MGSTLGGAGAQHVGVVDVGGTGHDGVHQGQHLAPRPGPAHPTAEAHGRVDPGSPGRAAGRGHAGGSSRPVPRAGTMTVSKSPWSTGSGGTFSEWSIARDPTA